MKFGYFHNPHDTTQQRPYVDVLRELRQMAQACDRGGFDVFWLPEHHFSVWGRELLPNPLMMLADLAARTERMRMGLAAAIITFWHPLRLAEDVALLDNLTDGRLELGVGRGNYGLEATNLNPQADPNNPEMNYKVFAETLAILKKALGEERFQHRGEIYSYPYPGFKADRAHSVNDPAYVDAATNELVRLTTFPRPHQRPHPPMWQVVDGDNSIEFAAANDLGIIMWRPPVKSLKRRLTLYKDTAKRTRGVDLPMGARTAIMRETFCAESKAEARRIAGDAALEALNFANWRGPKIYLDPDETLDPATEAALKKRLTWEFVEPRTCLFGSPDDIVAKLEELERETGIEQVVMACNWPGLAHEHSMRSIKLISDEVIPRFKERRAERKGRAAAAE